MPGRGVRGLSGADAGPLPGGDAAELDELTALVSRPSRTGRRAHERFRAEHENDTLIVDVRFKLVEGQPLGCPSVLGVARA